LGKVHVKNFWPKKLRKKTLFLSYFPLDFFNALLDVSLHEEPKNTIKMFLQIRKTDLKISKNLPKKIGRYVAFFFFFSLAPLANTHFAIHKKTTTKKGKAARSDCSSFTAAAAGRRAAADAALRGHVLSRACAI
jgi:hypothetical protein